jgi:hypothetical protein
MRLFEILRENTSSEAAVKIIVDVLSTQLPHLYRRLMKMADTFSDNHGGLGRKFNFITGGPKSEFYKNVYFKDLNPALHTFLKSLNRNDGIELKEFLSKYAGSGKFGIINELIVILGNISRSTNNKKLGNGVSAAKNAVRNYQEYLDKLELDNEDDEESDEKILKQPNIVGQQNASVEDIINDALSRVHKNQAGEIRNIIAKSDNKLMALQKEFTKRGIKFDK